MRERLKRYALILTISSTLSYAHPNVALAESSATLNGVIFTWPEKVYAPQSAVESENANFIVNFRNISQNDFYYVGFSTRDDKGGVFPLFAISNPIKAGSTGTLAGKLSYTYFLNFRGQANYTLTLCTKKDLMGVEDCTKGILVFTTNKSEVPDSSSNQNTKAKNCLSSGVCKIGDIGPGGGIVFYVSSKLEPWGRFMEVAPDGWFKGRQDPDVSQYCPSKPGLFDYIGKTSYAIGSGKQNTELLNRICVNGASRTATDYLGGGYSDWFLPSKDELNEVYWTRNATGIKTGSNYYWSSSLEERGESPVALFWPFGTFGTVTKNRVDTYLRPIRYFKFDSDVLPTSSPIPADNPSPTTESSNSLQIINQMTGVRTSNALNYKFTVPMGAKPDYYEVGVQFLTSLSLSPSQYANYSSMTILKIVKANEFSITYPEFKNYLVGKVAELDRTYVMVRVRSVLGQSKSDWGYGIYSSTSTMNLVEKSSTITCVKGKTTKRVTAINPQCPAGYKKK